jgi:hypothetical protein
MKALRYFAFVLANVVFASWTAQAQAPALSALARLPVRELTVFKDGHVYVIHEGALPVATDGAVQMDYLPTPILGTFWPYSLDKNVRLASVVASPRRVLVDRTSLTIRELIEGNPGAEVAIEDVNGKTIVGQIVDVPTRSASEQRETDSPGAPERLPERSSLVTIKTGEGSRITPMEQIRTITFKRDFKPKLGEEEFRNLLSLQLAWPNNHPAATANVGLMYVQKGVRWIPEYKLELDGKGEAKARLQATLIDDLIDLSDVSANLVIGVPAFAFQDTPDPMSLQASFAQLGPYFEKDARANSALSNAVMSQGTTLYERAVPAPPSLPEIGGAGAAEDLFVFTVKHVTLKRGQRAVLPVAEYDLKYRDVYTVDVPITPPRDLPVSGGVSPGAIREMLATQSQHVIRVGNSSKQPFTTAPALLLEGGRVLAQGTMNYTSPGSEAEIGVTAATDLKVKRNDRETARTPNAVKLQGDEYARVDLAGTLTLTNYSKRPMDIEVRRSVLGEADSADSGGKIVKLNALESDESASSAPIWSWYNWPVWWRRPNGMARIEWNVHLDAGSSVKLNYAWHYYWR